MLNKQRLYWTIQIGGWSIYGLIQIVSNILATSDPVSYGKIAFFLFEAVLCLVITHALRYFLNRWRWLRLPVPLLIPRVIGLVILMGVIVYFLRIPINLLIGRNMDPTVFSAEKIAGLTSVYTLMFFLWSVFYFTYHYIERYNKSLKYEAKMIEIELNNLKSQLNPHFIFNALNSIRALVDENPVKSKHAINQLSNILRNSLTFDKKGLTRFEDELKIVKDYLGLESIRFEERLKTEFDIQAGSNQFSVPPLMIQTLIENGIKHGISKLTAGGIVQLRTRIEKNRLKIQIRNSGHIQAINRRGNGGLGIKNTVQRLKLLYGDKASFRIVNENNNFVLTELIIPQIHST